MFKRWIFILVTSLSVLSCGKNNQNPVPNVPVDVTIDLSFPSYSALQGVSGYTYVNGGSRGIIVYRKSLDEFVAFDRHSPADIEGTCVEPLYPDANNFLELIDSCNNARFSLYDGSPISNSEYGLRQYATQYNGSNILRIFN
jgi:hypothetical protein